MSLPPPHKAPPPSWIYGIDGASPHLPALACEHPSLILRSHISGLSGLCLCVPVCVCVLVCGWGWELHSEERKDESVLCLTGCCFTVRCVSEFITC